MDAPWRTAQSPKAVACVACPPCPEPPNGVGFETYVVRDASLHFRDGWVEEMQLELLSFGVKACVAAQVPSVSRGDACLAACVVG
jgi:hypothetical protein